MVDKITTPPTQNEVIDKINELVDDKQDNITSSNKLSASLVSGLATVATSGSYNDLSNKPTIPTVNNATLTIQKNGTDVATFTANASSNVTANISVPTNNNQLTNGAGYITGIPYGESTSAADAVQKEVTISEITELKTGQIIIVKPTITSTVADATLKLNSFAAYPMLYGAAAITTSTDSITWAANYPSWFRFDGSNWVFLGHGVDNNTTYSTMSVAEGTTGTASSNRSLQARYLKQIIQGTTLTGISTSTNSAVTATDTVLVGIGKLQAQVNGKQATITSSNKLSASLVSGLATVATSGSYNDLSNQPTIPIVNNPTITFTQGGTTKGTITLNQSSNQTIALDAGGSSPIWSYDSTTRTLIIS